jgi:urease accessory protein
MRAISIMAALTWSGEPADRIVLDYDDRQRRRTAMTGQCGIKFLLDLPAAVGLHGGDALVLEDGRLIEVVAANEALLEIRCTDPQHLARLAWHLGNRHLPVELLTSSLRIRRDHVVAAMATGLGAQVVEIDAPFEPEGGAYAAAHHHHADDSQYHGHDRRHQDSHRNGHDHGR